jgi:hypothetical protein
MPDGAFPKCWVEGQLHHLNLGPLISENAPTLSNALHITLMITGHVCASHSCWSNSSYQILLYFRDGVSCLLSFNVEG